MIDGKALTEAIIRKNDFRDSQKKMHIPHGIFTFAANWYAHVCFDHHPEIGRQCWYGRTSELRIHILTSYAKPVLGSLPGLPFQHTGSGYRIDPIKAGMKSFNIDEFAGDLSENASDAVEIVKRWLKSLARNYRDATPEEQKKGIDLVNTMDSGLTFEVKSRFSPAAKHREIYVQLGETNPCGKH